MYSAMLAASWCNHAYQETRRALLANARALTPVLRRSGLRLNIERLRDPRVPSQRQPESAPRMRVRAASASERPSIASRS